MTHKSVLPPLLFIVGVGRSGTSLLQAMFASHPEMSYMPETSFVRRYVATGTLQSALDEGGEVAVLKILQKDEVFARMGIDVANLLSGVLPASDYLDAEIYRKLVSSYAVEKKWAGDKDPKLIEFLPLLKNFFPTAHVINIIRDPRDVLASKKKAEWSKNGHVWKHVFANRVQLALGRRNGPQFFGKNYHEIIYEELITSPREVLEKLCEDITLPFDEAMLSFGNAAQKLVSDKEISWKKETLGPLLRGNKGKWKYALATREILLTESCCGEAMAAGGYRLNDLGRRLSLGDWLWQVGGAFVIKAASFPYMLYRNNMMAATCQRPR